MDTEEAEVKEENFIEGFKDVNSFSQQAFKNLMMAIKHSNDLPSAGDDFDYYSSFEAFRHAMDVEQQKILHLIQTVMRYHGAKGNLSTSSAAVDIEDKYDVLVDANDQLLERVGSFLDEASGLKKKEASLVVSSMTPKHVTNTRHTTASWNKKASPGNVARTPSYRLLTAKSIQRPQLSFKDKVDNRPVPFIPKIRHKPNAIKPLSERLLKAQEHSEQGIDLDSTEHSHPYEYELDQFEPSAENLSKVEPQNARNIEESPLTYVETLKQLLDMLEIFKVQTEIAVDTEHHSYRSYLGFVCLIQISTREEDFIIDTLQLRHELWRLNDIFTNPKIVKVLHGADMDIEWLQKDFGVYIVNMFDTGQASRVLNLPRYSLSWLMNHYCQVTADKQYQLADWRIRPLPDELITYAREDTHYLLYIYDCMRNELLDRANGQPNLIQSVYVRSKQVASKVFVKHIWHEESHMELYRRSKKRFNAQQLEALKGLYHWRDTIARTEDESTGYVLPNHMMLQIADLLPREMQGVLACCNPIPPLVRQCSHEIHEIIKKAREVSNKVEVKEKPKLLPTKKQHPMYDSGSILHSCHDLSHSNEHITLVSTEQEIKPLQLPDPSLLSDVSSIFRKEHLKETTKTDSKSKSLCSVFDWKPWNNDIKSQTEGQKRAAALRASFTSPLDMYIPKASNIVGPVPESIVQPAKLTLGKQATSLWKLSKNTPKKTEVEVTVDTDVMPISLRHNKFVESLTNPEPDPSDTVRNMLPNRKKRKHIEVDPDTPKRKEEQKSSPENVQTTSDNPEFQPYDYATKGASLFKVDHREKKAKKHFDPHKSAGQKSEKRVSGPNIKPMSGQKSFTYTKNKQSSSKLQWPKR